MTDCKHENITLDDIFLEDGEVFFVVYQDSEEFIYSLAEIKKAGYKLVKVNDNDGI